MLIVEYFANFPPNISLKEKYEWLRKLSQTKAGPIKLFLDDWTCLKYYEPLYPGYLGIFPGLSKILSFITKNIAINIDKLYYQEKTLGVYIRIITSMLNKAMESGQISKNQNILIHHSIIYTIKEALKEWEIYTNNYLYKDVPF